MYIKAKFSAGRTRMLCETPREREREGVGRTVRGREGGWKEGKDRQRKREGGRTVRGRERGWKEGGGGREKVRELETCRQTEREGVRIVKDKERMTNL